MRERISTKLLRAMAIACVVAVCAVSAVAAFKNMAIVTSASSKVNDVTLADLAKFCKGATKAWPDGRNFSIVIKSPDAPEMHGVLQKLFGAAGSDAKVAIAKLNETHTVVKVVESDDELLKAVESTPGAVGVVDVYSINSSVKVLRIDGKLPFDVGYALKGN
jgi:ABC-type phosphate transport system substrate-binding protein